MIRCAIKGGLGNQMFQFAAAYAKAKNEHTKLELDLSFYEKSIGRDFFLDRFVLDDSVVVPFSNFKFGRPRILRSSKRHGIRFIERCFHFDEEVVSADTPLLLDGYFQSERYFDRHISEIRKAYELRQQLSLGNSATSDLIKSCDCAVSIHVRKGDYLLADNSLVHVDLPLDYYRRASGIMRNILGREPSFFYFSDDTDFVNTHFSLGVNDYVVQGLASNPEEDMYLMSLCNHHIIANSSFSWWGAWLNPSFDKLVLAPRQWFQPEIMRQKNTCDLYPKEWVLI